MEYGKGSNCNWYSTGIGYETFSFVSKKRICNLRYYEKFEEEYDLQEIAAKERIPLMVLPLDVNDDRSVSKAIDTIECFNIIFVCHVCICKKMVKKIKAR